MARPKAIGAKSTYSECSNSAGNKFDQTGDGKSSELAMQTLADDHKTLEACFLHFPVLSNQVFKS